MGFDDANHQELPDKEEYEKWHRQAFPMAEENEKLQAKVKELELQLSEAMKACPWATHAGNHTEPKHCIAALHSQCEILGDERRGLAVELKESNRLNGELLEALKTITGLHWIGYVHDGEKGTKCLDVQGWERAFRAAHDLIANPTPHVCAEPCTHPRHSLKRKDVLPPGEMHCPTCGGRHADGPEWVACRMKRKCEHVFTDYQCDKCGAAERLL